MPADPPALLHGVAGHWHGAASFAVMAERNVRDAEACRHGAAAVVRLFSPDRAVLTLGRRVHDVERAGLTETVARCRVAGVDVLPVDRGGQATLHLPGQIVALIAVPCARVQLAALVRELLDGAEQVARSYGVSPDRGATVDTGLWLQERKLVSIGLRHQGGVARHGVAVNVAVDAPLSQRFVLCGHAGSGYANLHEGGRSPSVAAVARALATAWGLASP